MSVPSFLQTYLASYDLSGLDVKIDKNLIITEILNKGNKEAYSWLYENYSKSDIQEVISKPTRGMWLKGILQYWLKMFNLTLNKHQFEKAELNIN